MNSSKLPLPFEVTLLVLRHALATPTPTTRDKQFHASLLLVNRQIYSALVEHVYCTVVLQFSAALYKLCHAIESSQHLGPLIQNLWVGHKDSQDSGVVDHEESMDMLQRVLANTTTLRRLYISADASQCSGMFNHIYPGSLRHLAVPTMWLAKSGRTAGLWAFPQNLELLYIRGKTHPYDMVVGSAWILGSLKLIVELDDISDLRSTLESIAYTRSLEGRSRIKLVEIRTPPRLHETLRGLFMTLGNGVVIDRDGEMQRLVVTKHELDEDTQLRTWLVESETSNAGSITE